MQHAHSKQLFTRHLYDKRAKASDNVLINSLFDLLFAVVVRNRAGSLFLS